MTHAILWTCILFNAASATITPETPDLQGISAALEKAAPGDTVQLSECVYQITGPIHMKSGVNLIGAGQDKTRIVYAGDKPGVFIEFKGCDNVELAHCTLDGRNNLKVQQGIVGADSRQLSIHHLTICDLPNSGGFGPHAMMFNGQNPSLEHGVVDSRIADCVMENIGQGAEYGGGVRLSWGCVRNRIERNIIRNTGRGGIFGDHSDDLTIIGNRVSGSGGEGLGIEVWEGCARALIEDNVIDHWLSVGGGFLTAVRRNVIEADDGSLKGFGLEVIARDCVITNNRVGPGQQIGLTVSNAPVKNNIYWADNVVDGCIQWGAQLQGDEGRIARHYFYRCTIQNTQADDPRAKYKGCAGHAFRTNGNSRELMFDQCVFQNNGGVGFQFGGENVDAIAIAQCRILNNGNVPILAPTKYSAFQWSDCVMQSNKSEQLPEIKPFALPGPQASFEGPEKIRVGEPIVFQCTSKSPGGRIVERLWDFGQGLPAVEAEPKHCFERPGEYRVVLVVWDESGRASRQEKLVVVLPSE